MLYPSDCLVSPATTEKSAPAMARMVPPFSEYGLNCLCTGNMIYMSTSVLVMGGGVRESVDELCLYIDAVCEDGE